MGLQLVEPQDGKVDVDFKQVFNIIVKPTSTYDKIVIREKQSGKVITETRNPPANQDLPFTLAGWNSGTWEIVGIVNGNETDKLEVQVNVSTPFQPPAPPPTDVVTQFGLSVYAMSQILMATAFIHAFTKVIRALVKRVSARASS